ncbi:MAG: hypothetical protein OXF06_07925 [Bacteroidetes bacterium]|nr:hypothetical protein [Bacteroidota bacterium]
MNHDNDFQGVGIDVTGSQDIESYAHAEHRRLFEKKEASHKRSQQFKINFHWVSLVGLWIGFLVILAFIVVWTWHILMPETRHFVSDAKMDTIEAVILSIIGSSAFTLYAHNMIRKLND